MSLSVNTFVPIPEQEIVCLQVRSSLRLSQKSIPADLLVRRLEPDFTRVVVSRAPVRVDIAGGWSDTPPICYESSGSVSYELLFALF